MISLVDALLPSLIRHVLACSATVKWRYFDDPFDPMHIHYSTQVMLDRRILVPLLKSQCKKSIDTDGNARIFENSNISYFHPRVYQEAVMLANK